MIYQLGNNRIITDRVHAVSDVIFEGLGAVAKVFVYVTGNTIECYFDANQDEFDENYKLKGDLFKNRVHQEVNEFITLAANYNK